MTTPCIYLASQSPRRRELLEQIGVRFDVLSIDISEDKNPTESPYEYVERLAVAKANAGKNALNEQYLESKKKPLWCWQSKKKHATIDIVIGSDTVVVCDEQVLGKPASNEDAVEILRLLSGRTHEVLTGVAVSGSSILTAVSRNLVTFRELTELDISRYVATNEGRDKAGGYAVQGLAAIFIEKIQGSYSGVMGLPVYETANLLEQSGVQILPSVN